MPFSLVYQINRLIHKLQFVFKRSAFIPLRKRYIFDISEIHVQSQQKKNRKNKKLGYFQLKHLQNECDSEENSFYLNRVLFISKRKENKKI